MTSHLLGAAGGIEAIITVLAIHDQFFSPTRNLENLDPACDLDYVPIKGYAGRSRGHPQRPRLRGAQLSGPVQGALGLASARNLAIRAKLSRVLRLRKRVPVR